MNSKTIGIDASRYPLTPHITGVELYTKKIIDGLIPLLHSHPLRLYTRTHLPLSAPNLTQIIIPRHRLWTHLGLSQELKKNPIPNLFIPSHLPPLSPPPQTTLVVHGIEALHFPQAYTLFQRKYHLLSLRRAIRTCSTLIAVSNSIRQDLITHLHCPPEKIKVIPHGFEPTSYQPSPGEKKTHLQILQKYGLTSTQPYILNIGRLEPRKNQLRLVQAFQLFQKKFPNYHLVLAGPITRRSRPILKLIKKLNLKPKIHLLGSVPHPHIKHLLTSANLFAYPSLSEGFGFPLLEAFATQTPTLTSNTGSLPEIGNSAVLKVNPLSIKEITSGLITLASQPDLRQKLIQKGLSRLSDFSWKTCLHLTASTLLSQP